MKEHFIDVPLEEWDETHLKEAFEKLAEHLSAKRDRDYQLDTRFNRDTDPAKAFRVSFQHFLRWALMGRPGPALMSTMALLGRDVSLHRIEEAVALFDILVTEANQA